MAHGLIDRDWMSRLDPVQAEAVLFEGPVTEAFST